MASRVHRSTNRKPRINLTSLWLIDKPGRVPGFFVRHKSPYLRTSSFLKMAVRGGLTRFARPAGVMACGHSVQRAGPVVEPRSGILIPPERAICKKKPVLAYELFLKYGGEGGIDSLRSPCGRHGLRPFRPTGWARCRTPVGDSHPPGACNMQKKARTCVRALS